MATSYKAICGVACKISCFVLQIHLQITNAFEGNRIAVRFVYEWHDDAGNWFRSHGNENWAFDAQGLMTHRHASINDQPIKAEDRKFHWPLGRRPDDHPGLTELGL